MDDAAREKLLKTFKPGSKVEVSRFKGLGEMPPAMLKDTTMDPAKRTLAPRRRRSGNPRLHL